MIIKQLLPIQKTFITDSDDFAESVMIHMERNLGDYLQTRMVDGEVGYFGTFQEFDKADNPIGKEMIGRFFIYGIGRYGGVKKIRRFDRSSLEEIEDELGCSAGFLTESDDKWDGEETEDEAFSRKYGANHD